ncbi:MAG TPA: radical SAM protein [Chryseosolibacter sp.]|nr:radical SAM protein [Chryseosolibacter sp.]
MINVLLTNSYFYRFDQKQWRFKQPYPPLATLIAASVLRTNGYNVDLFDASLSNDPEKITHHFQLHRPKYLFICDDGFNYLTKMCLTVMREAAFQMCKLAKKVGCTVIVSSSDAADHYEKYFAAGADFVIRGEVENTIIELLDAIEKRKDIGQVSGVIFKQSGKTVTGAPRSVMRDLDSLPLPAWDLIDINAYKQIWKKHHGYFSLNVATTRGCPFKCNWCAKPIYGNRYNSRSPENVVNEIEYVLKNYQPDHFWMCDDIFGLKPGWIQEFNALVRKRNLHFRFKIQSRADLLLESDTIQALASSGAETVWIGAESGSQKILDAMEKGTTVEQIHEATALLRRNNIKIAFFLQFGYPGETLEDIQATMAMVMKLMPDEVGISISYPLPGTKFYENVKLQLREKQNWNDSDDLDMMFQSTFNRKYYRDLHQYVHTIYRKKKGLLALKKLVQDPLTTTRKDIRTGLSTLYFFPKSISQKWKLKKSKETITENVL